jgi:hypothetical protein
MTHSINYVKLLKLFQDSKMDGSTYLLEDDIKEEVVTLLKTLLGNMLKDDDNWAFDHYSGIFDIDQIKIDLPNMFELACQRLETKLINLRLSAYTFILDLNDVSQYDAYKEFDDDMNPFYKYCLTIAEFWLDELENVQGQYLIDRDQNAADLIAMYYLESIYSPYTVLGIKRFDKERKELFG